MEKYRSGHNGADSKNLKFFGTSHPQSLNITDFFENLILLILQFPKGVPKDFHTFCRAEKYKFGDVPKWLKGPDSKSFELNGT